MKSLTRVQLDAAQPILDRLVPAQRTVEECRVHLALLLRSWGFDPDAIEVDFSTGAVRPLPGGPPGPPPFEETKTIETTEELLEVLARGGEVEE